MKQFFPATPKPEVLFDGKETLSIHIEWVKGHRDKVRVVHFSVPNSEGQQKVEVLVEGRSMNDLMKSFAQFLDYDLEINDEGFLFKVQKGEVA